QAEGPNLGNEGGFDLAIGAPEFSEVKGAKGDEAGDKDQARQAPSQGEIRRSHGCACSTKRESMAWARSGTESSEPACCSTVPTERMVARSGGSGPESRRRFSWRSGR